MVNTKVKLCGITLTNPIIAASGTFGYGVEFANLYDINCLGSFSFKGTTKEKRDGNPASRIAEGKNGILNSVGLQNPGIDRVIKQVIPVMKKIFHKPIMANVSGFSVEEYVECVKKLNRCPEIGWIEINVSCPNVHGGGMAFGTDPNMIAKVTRAVKKVSKKPIIIKLSPNVTDIVKMAKACEKAGADAISLINTIVGMRIDLKKRAPVLKNKFGGYSGDAIFPIALRMVYQVAHAVKIPVIGMGGISTAEDVIEMMLAGATAVEIGSANLVDPYVCPKIIKDLPKVMKQYKINSLDKIIGGCQ
ncbi:MAG: dihydroorotate dehydrogenase [Bacilli bacterium]|nr:dihydroorotate dehydrogenase [Bacilli bacterium]